MIPDKSATWEQMQKLLDKELAAQYIIPPQYFYETAPRSTATHVAEMQRRMAPLWDRVLAIDRKRLAAKAEARVMGTNNLAPSRADDGPVILGIDWAIDDQPDEWDAEHDDHQPQGATMNLSTAIFLVSDEVRAVRVGYDPSEPGKEYLFKTLDSTIQKDDMVVVQTNTRHGFTICKVMEVDCQVDFDSTIQYKWCAKFDKATFDAILAQEQGILDRIAKAEQTRKRHELAASLKLDEQGLTGLTLLAGPTADTTAS